MSHYNLSDNLFDDLSKNIVNDKPITAGGYHEITIQ